MSILHQPSPPAGQAPFICVPIMAANLSALGVQLSQILPHAPDMLEFRVDFMLEISPLTTLAAIDLIRAYAPTIPLIVSFRSPNQGGQVTSVKADEVFALLADVCVHGKASYIDYETQHTDNEIKLLRHLSEKHQVGLILSHHDFAQTPPDETLDELTIKAYEQGADVIKLALMPQSASDVLRILNLSAQWRQHLDVALITIAMGELGAFSRLIGGHYGSCVSFASVNGQASAPGQWSIEETRAACHVLYKTPLI